VVKPEVSVAALTPAFLYLAAWYLMAGIVYGFFGIETRGRSFEVIEQELEAQAVRSGHASLAVAAGVGKAGAQKRN
jgi:putative MFS transporter